jgi:hypothetical protein
MSTDPQRPDRTRASDAEREEFATIVRNAMTEGRLTLEEGEERLAQVYAAKFRDELAPLTIDLPDGGRPAPEETPQDRAAFRSGMGRHVGFVVAVTAVLVGLWALSGAHFFWPAIPLTFMAIGLVRHARWRQWRRLGGPPWAGPGWSGPGQAGQGWGGHHHGHGGHGRDRGGWDRRGWEGRGWERRDWRDGEPAPWNR